MTTQSTPAFDYGLLVGSLVNSGRVRPSNEDEVIVCPEAGFYAVSDGMGGLPKGGRTALLLKETLPHRMTTVLHAIPPFPSPENAAGQLKQEISKISDMIYYNYNPVRWQAGATLSGVRLTGRHALFVNLGDSRGYLLPRNRKKIRQITDDHNQAAALVKEGKITKEMAITHVASTRLTRFVGMTPPVIPDLFIEEVCPGDRILLCSDGLYGMVSETDLSAIMGSSPDPDLICERLVEKANAQGGWDNISVVYIEVIFPPP